MEQTFPYNPHSALCLRPGHFWALPLPDGRFGAACVISNVTNLGQTSKNLFVAGVIDWIGPTAPTKLALKNCTLLKFGVIDIRTIYEGAGEILGIASIDLPAAPEDSAVVSLPSWGFRVPALIAQVLAESSSSPKAPHSP